MASGAYETVQGGLTSLDSVFCRLGEGAWDQMGPRPWASGLRTRYPCSSHASAGVPSGTAGRRAGASRRFEIATSYDAEVNVAELLSASAESSAALICGDERAEYDELWASVATVQAALQERCPTGSTIAVIGGTSIDFVKIVVGALSAGLPVLPLHPRYPSAELQRALDLAHPVLLVVTDDEAAALAGGLGVPSCSATELLAPAANLDDPMTMHARPVDDQHPALLLFTSGTAGDPRVAVLSHGNVTASIEQTVASAQMLVDGTHTTMGVMPLSHVLGLVSVVGVSLRVGATLVLAKDVSVDGVVADVERNTVTLLVAPPVFWYRLAESGIGRSRLASVQLAMSGAAPLSGSLARSVKDRFGLDIRQGYGLTEASPGLTSSVGTNAPATSVGRPVPGVELRLVDEFGDDALVGDVGEVWARGANVFAGYLNDDDATAQVIDADGWLHTGDLAVVDEQGHLYIVGRSKDQIIVAGFNVHPGEVEDLLARHPHVEAAVVVGEADREYGEVVVAHVLAAPGQQPDFADLAQHCRAQLAGYKCPARFELVDELPRGTTGKLRRRELRE